MEKRMSEIGELTVFRFCTGQVFLVFKKDVDDFTALDEEMRKTAKEIDDTFGKGRNRRALKNPLTQGRVSDMFI
jgi:hypothetical protein